MDSGLYTKVFTSTEVIAASLFLILLLPLVFFIASTKSRRRFVRAPTSARRTRPRPQAARPAQKDEEGEETPAPRRRAAGPEEDDASEADHPR